MSGLHGYIESIWWHRQQPPLWLRACEPLYAAINRRNLEQRAACMSEPPLPMISVGNITAGGSGKTPFVAWLAKALRTTGCKPVILCRGDGGSSRDATLVAPDDPASIVGDEALLLARQSECPVIAAADRVAGSRLAATYGDILILDDGFQYRHLGRCCDIVLIPDEGTGNGHQIPAGPLREPLEALTRADLIVRTGSGDAAPLSEQQEWRWRAHPGELTDLMGVEAAPPTQLHAATAIARPERFFRDLGELGFRLSGQQSFRDHHRFTAGDVAALLDQPNQVAVTAKDAVKLQPLWPRDRPLWQLDQSVEAEAGLFEAINSHLSQG